MATSFAYKPIVTDGLVFSLDAANLKSYPGSGTTWLDLTSNGSDGDLTNGPTFDSVNGGNIVFDGVNDYVDLVDSEVLKFTNTSSFSISVWFKWTSSSSSGASLFSYALGGGRGYYILLDGGSVGLGTDLVFCDYFDGGSYRGIQSGNNSISRNIWHNLVATCDTSNSASGMKFYLDGSLISSTARSGSGAPSSINYSGLNARIGARETSFPFTGKIPSVLVWNRNLSQEEIFQNFNATKSRFEL